MSIKSAPLHNHSLPVRIPHRNAKRNKCNNPESLNCINPQRLHRTVLSCIKSYGCVKKLRIRKSGDIIPQVLEVVD